MLYKHIDSPSSVRRIYHDLVIARSPEQYRVHRYIDSLRCKQHDHECIRISERGRNPNDAKYDVLTNQDRDEVLRAFRASGVKDKKAVVVLNVGRKKQGKSTTACMQSLALCEHGCKFVIGSDSQHQTFGIDCSPPLRPSFDKIYPKATYNRRVIDDVSQHRVVIVDIEGLENKNHEEMMKLLEPWIAIASVIVHVCWPKLEDEDYFIAKQVHDIMDTQQRRNLKYMVAVATSLNNVTATSEIWQNIEQMAKKDYVSPFEPPQFCKLPDLDEELWSMIYKRNEEKKQYPNLFQFISEPHCGEYVQFATDLIVNVKQVSSVKKVQEAIEKTMEIVDFELDDLVIQSYCVYDGETLKRERIIGDDLKCDSCPRRCNNRVRYYCPLGATALHPNGCNLCDKCRDNPSTELIKKANDVKEKLNETETNLLKQELQKEAEAAKRRQIELETQTLKMEQLEKMLETFQRNEEQQTELR